MLDYRESESDSSSRESSFKRAREDYYSENETLENDDTDGSDGDEEVEEHVDAEGNVISEELNSTVNRISDEFWKKSVQAICIPAAR